MEKPMKLLSASLLAFGLVVTGCRTTDRLLGAKDHSGDDKSQQTSDLQKINAQISRCEVVEKKVWDRASSQCLTQEQYCFQKKDGSIWMNKTCLSLEHQCLLDGGSWDNNACKTPEMQCREKLGHVWRDGRCLSSKDDCLGQKNAYRYQWVMAKDAVGECKLKTFMDYCQEGTAAPRGVQYTVAIIKRLANNTSSCLTADKWVSDTIKRTHKLELYDLQDRISIEDISPLVGYGELEELTLTNNKIADLSPLASLKNLKVLDLQNNSVEDLQGLENLVHLESLFLGHNKVSNLGPLQGLTSLKRLHLFDNRLRDVKALETLVGLEVLYLKTNAIQNIFPLRKLFKLQELDLRENPLYNPDLAKNSDNCPVGDDIAPKVSQLCKELLAQEVLPSR